MLIEFIADVACPWCFIGLRHLRQAMAQRPQYLVQMQWRPFLLNPDLHHGKIERTDYLKRVFGSQDRVRQFYEAIDTAGLNVGVPFSFEDTDFTPSSLNGHGLISLAAEKADDVILDVAEDIFYAYFVDGQDIDSLDVLARIGVEHGLDEDLIRKRIGQDDMINQVLNENSRVHRLGINGVPSFVFGRRNIISGAQEPRSLIHMMDYLATIERLDDVGLSPSMATIPDMMQS